MKRFNRWLAAAAILLTGVAVPAGGMAETLQPFVLGSTTQGADLKSKVAETREALSAAGFTVLGEYSPNDKATAIVVTSDALQRAATQSKRGAYGAVARVGVTQAGDAVQVAYINPVYMQHAYRMEADLSGVAAKLAEALGADRSFGSEDGMEVDDLRDYRYMFGMEYFDDPYELGEFPSHEAAVEAVEKGLASAKAGVAKVYRLDLPGEQTLFGVSLSAGPSGDQYRDDNFQMGVVDFGDLKKTAYLPYEILVNGKEVEALHMRFRMAVFFPDLSMMGDNSFMEVRPSPGAIEDAFQKTLGTKKESFIDD